MTGDPIKKKDWQTIRVQALFEQLATAVPDKEPHLPSTVLVPTQSRVNNEVNPYNDNEETVTAWLLEAGFGEAVTSLMIEEGFTNVHELMKVTDIKSLLLIEKGADAAKLKRGLQDFCAAHASQL